MSPSVAMSPAAAPPRRPMPWVASRHQSEHPQEPCCLLCVTCLTLDACSNSISAIVTLVIGQEQRIFAAHENVLAVSPFFQSVLQNQMLDSQSKKIALPDEEPEIFSSVLEYLYKGDYYPRLIHNKKRNSWELEQPPQEDRHEPTMFHHGMEGELLKDTVIYCAAEKYGLDELKRVALRKQGLRK